MKTLIAIIALGIVGTALADSHETKTYVYATYSNCNVAEEEGADKTFERYSIPQYKEAMESGDISGWGYMKHHLGGNWRRLSYHMGSSPTALIAASDKMGAALDDKVSARNDNFSKACHTHDDYIWESKHGSAASAPGKVALSVYMICNMSDEARADELVKDVFAKAYDAQVGPGKLTSWGWLSHVMGGEYRRLLTMTAASVDDLVNARAELLSSMQGSAAAREFTSICGSHTDYLWEIVQAGR